MDAFDFKIRKRKRVPVPLKQIKFNLGPHENEVRGDVVWGWSILISCREIV